MATATSSKTDQKNREKIFRQSKRLLFSGDIPENLEFSKGQRFLFISKDQRYLTHSIHKYPAKFFPELPRWLIRRYSEIGDLVVDPFMGSGTTNLEASLVGRRSIGIDIDPFSRFIARTKIGKVDVSKLDFASKVVLNSLEKFNEKKSLKLPDFPYVDKWFTPHVLKELSYLKETILDLRFPNNIKNIFLVTFSSIIRQVSQADNNCTRTVIRKKMKKNIAPMYSFNLFKKRLAENISNFSLLAKKELASVEIPTGSSATDLSPYDDNSIDFALTSPPYLNAVDYPRTHQLEMYWLDFAKGSLVEHKKKHVGTETVSAQDYRHLCLTGLRSADDVIRAIYEVDPRRSFIAYKFLSDMQRNLFEIYRVLKMGGYYAVVIGNNQVRGHLFETWKYLIDAAEKIGFELETYFLSDIINHFIKVPRKQRIDSDYVLILKK